MIRLSILLPLTLFYKHREHFVHKKCMAVERISLYYMYITCLISIIATCRFAYTIRKIWNQSFRPCILYKSLRFLIISQLQNFILIYPRTLQGTLPTQHQLTTQSHVVYMYVYVWVDCWRARITSLYLCLLFAVIGSVQVWDTWIFVCLCVGNGDATSHF